MQIQQQKVDYPANSPVKISFLNIRNLSPHYHYSDLEILYCFKGSVTITSAFETIVLTAGEYYTVSHYDIHCIRSDVENILMMVHLDLTASSIPWAHLKDSLFVFETFWGSDITEVVPEFADVSSKVNDILMLLGFLSSDESSDKNMLPQCSDKLLTLLFSHFSYANYACRKLELPENSKEIFYKMSEYIHENYSKKISLATFAETLHFSKSHTAAFIKNNLNLTFNYALNYMRCFQAEHMLLTTDKSNPEISGECGFSDNKYFYANFKKWYGRTPIRHKEWYEEYCKKADAYNEIPSALLKPFIEEYYCRYHSNKTMEYVCSDM